VRSKKKFLFISYRNFWRSILTKRLTDKERLLVEGHLQDCTACQDVLKSMEELRTLIKAPVKRLLRRRIFPWYGRKLEGDSFGKTKLVATLRPGLISPSF